MRRSHLRLAPSLELWLAVCAVRMEGTRPPHDSWRGMPPPIGLGVRWRHATPHQTFGPRVMPLKHAQRLMKLHARRLETLNKTRGKGQQRVTVERVPVEAGGQAIVGTIERGGRPALGQRGERGAIDKARDMPLDATPSQGRHKTGRSKS